MGSIAIVTLAKGIVGIAALITTAMAIGAWWTFLEFEFADGSGIFSTAAACTLSAIGFIIAFVRL